MRAGDPPDIPAGGAQPNVDTHPDAGSSEPQLKAPGAARGGLASRLRPVLIGGLILALGLGTSAFLAAEWRTSAQHANRQAFTTEATDLGGTVQSKLNTTVGLTRVLRAIATMEPRAGQTRLLEWVGQLQRDAPVQPGVTAVLIEPVSASGLPAFKRGLQADPASRSRLAGSLQVVPSGNRPVYCLTRAIVGTSAATSLFPPLLDYCAPVLPGIGRSPYATLIRTVSDTGTFIVTPATGANSSLAAIGAAVYRRGLRSRRSPSAGRR